MIYRRTIELSFNYTVISYGILLFLGNNRRLFMGGEYMARLRGRAQNKDDVVNDRKINGRNMR